MTECVEREEEPEYRVLSVQSHVVSGYVGNKAAVFPLQLSGIDVDIINTVHFSNHTGYPGGCEGTRLDGEALGDIIRGMKRNGLLDSSTHLLTGYIGTESVLSCIPTLLNELRANGRQSFYLCDPVIGDDGTIYVPERVIDVYRSQIMRLADFVTPNQFEAELLTGTEIKCEEDAVAACDALHAMGIKMVAITSLFYTQDQTITFLASEATPDGGRARFRIVIPKMDEYYSGTGDLLAALLLLYSQKRRMGLREACEYAVSVVQAVLERTKASGKQELRLIQSRDVFDNPVKKFHAITI